MIKLKNSFYAHNQQLVKKWDSYLLFSFICGRCQTTLNRFGRRAQVCTLFNYFVLSLIHWINEFPTHSYSWIVIPDFDDILECLTFGGAVHSAIPALAMTHRYVTWISSWFLDLYTWTSKRFVRKACFLPLLYCSVFIFPFPRTTFSAS